MPLKKILHNFLVRMVATGWSHASVIEALEHCLETWKTHDNMVQMKTDYGLKTTSDAS